MHQQDIPEMHDEEMYKFPVLFQQADRFCTLLSQSLSVPSPDFPDHEEMKLPFEIADDVPRTDFIVLEAIVFPGINLFWLGSLMMLGGLAISMFYRRRKKSEVPVYELEEESYA